jgi:hypothetical protein
MMAEARRKEDATQLRDNASMEKSRPIAGRATFTDDPIKGVVNELMVVARRTMGNFLGVVMGSRHRKGGYFPGKAF